MTATETTQASHTKKQPWDQQPDETVDAFILFQQYLENGPEEGHKDLADQTGRTLAAVRQLAYRHHWSDRGAAWRQHLAQIRFQAIEQATRDQTALLASRASISRQLDWEENGRLSEVNRHLINNVINDPNAKCSISELCHLIQTASKLRRQATEVPEANNAPAYNPDTDPIILRFREHLRKACGRDSEPQAAASSTIVPETKVGTLSTASPSAA